MSALMINTSSYLDFFDIAKEAYESQKVDIYRKIMITLIEAYKKILQHIEIENLALEKEQNLAIDEESLETFYDNIYDVIDLVKLLKNYLMPYREKDGLFEDLYTIVNKLHEALVVHLDIISTQEVKLIQDRYKAS